MLSRKIRAREKHKCHEYVLEYAKYPEHNESDRMLTLDRDKPLEIYKKYKKCLAKK